MVVVGLVGYVETPRGLRALTTVWAEHLNDEVKRRFYKNWFKSKKRAFTKYVTKYKGEKKEIVSELARIKKYCSVVRVIAHTQIHKVGLRQKKAHVMEIQVNGGDVAKKVDFGYGLFEKTVPVDTVFTTGETVDICGVTKGHGCQGVIKRWGVRRLPRKTRRGLRKVACIGAWHPARVSWTVPRAGQLGYHQRTELHKRIYRLGLGKDTKSATTETDLTEKRITRWAASPTLRCSRRGLPHDPRLRRWPHKRVVSLRKSLLASAKRVAHEPLHVKFIDTSSKHGHGRFRPLPRSRRSSVRPSLRPSASARPGISSPALSHDGDCGPHLVFVLCSMFVVVALPIHECHRTTCFPSFYHPNHRTHTRSIWLQPVPARSHRAASACSSAMLRSSVCVSPGCTSNRTSAGVPLLARRMLSSTGTDASSVPCTYTHTDTQTDRNTNTP